MRVNVTPGTDEWHEWRKGGIGASLAPVIMGESPYQTPRQLAEELLGLRPAKPSNFAMNLGSAFEESALKMVGTGHWTRNLCFQHDQYSELRASLDGYEERENHIIEIKLVSAKELETIKEYQLPLEKHGAQLAQQSFVVNAEVVTYLAYTLESGKQSIVDAAMISVDFSKPVLFKYREDVITKVKEFWAMINRGELPPYGPDDVIEIESDLIKELSNRYVVLKDQLAAIQDKLDDTAELLWGHLKDTPNAKCGRLSFSTSHRQGSINYKAIEALKGLNLDNYRSSPVVVKQIRVNKE